MIENSGDRPMDISYRCSVTNNNVIHVDYVEMPKARKQSTRPRKVNYLNNADLLKQVILSKERGKMSDELAKMLMLLVQRYASRGNFVNYSYNDDMQSAALLQLMTSWSTFKPERSSNPFAFYTECIKNSFRYYLTTEKKHTTLRDMLYIEAGLNPSYNFDNQCNDNHFVEDEQSYDHVIAQTTAIERALDGAEDLVPRKPVSVFADVEE